MVPPIGRHASKFETLPDALVFETGVITLHESVAIGHAIRVSIVLMAVRIGNLTVASVALAVVESVTETAFTLVRYRVVVVPGVSVVRRSPPPTPAPGAESRTAADKNTRPHHHSLRHSVCRACRAEAQHNRQGEKASNK